MGADGAWLGLRKGPEASATAASTCGLSQMPCFSGPVFGTATLSPRGLELEFTSTAPRHGAGTCSAVNAIHTLVGVHSLSPHNHLRDGYLCYPILQMRKPKHREVKGLLQVTQLSGWGCEPRESCTGARVSPTGAVASFRCPFKWGSPLSLGSSDLEALLDIFKDFSATDASLWQGDRCQGPVSLPPQVHQTVG